MKFLKYFFQDFWLMKQDNSHCYVFLLFLKFQLKQWIIFVPFMIVQYPHLVIGMHSCTLRYFLKFKKASQLSTQLSLHLTFYFCFSFSFAIVSHFSLFFSLFSFPCIRNSYQSVLTRPTQPKTKNKHQRGSLVRPEEGSLLSLSLSL
jgi:hypothetical protein